MTTTEKKSYKYMYPDVELSNIDPIIHYDKIGRFIGRSLIPIKEASDSDTTLAPRPTIDREEFDGDWYLDQYPDVAKAKMDPYDHYINHGIRDKRLGLRRGSHYPQTTPINNERFNETLEIINSWPRKPLISIIMPTYNTNKEWLCEAIESVIRQSYTNWELCIADDASPNPDIKSVLDKYRIKDSRIKVTYRTHNGRVSAASNTALGMATGCYTALMDHDDTLERDALYYISENILNDMPDIIYTDELIVGENSSDIINHAFRPSFSLELLRSHPYIVHLVTFRTELLKEIGGFDESLTVSQDYDLILRAVEKSFKISHIPRALYRWRTHLASTGHNEINNVSDLSKKIIANHLIRCDEEGSVLNGACFNFFETHYSLNKHLRVAIIIPTKNHGYLVRQCIDSIKATVIDVDYEIILIDHESDEKESLDYFSEISINQTVLNYKGDFNYSKINNWAIKQLESKFSHYLLCNNDIEAINTGWLNRMLELCQKKDVGIVGAKLYYPDKKTIQHSGVCVGMFGAAEHYGKFMERDLGDDRGIHPGYIGSLITNREVSAVTAACMLIRSDTFEEVNGFDENLVVGFGDVDICLRVRESGYRIIFCPHAELIHHESISRGKSIGDPHPEDSIYFINRWHEFIDDGDPFYNPNLTLFNTHWSLKREEEFQIQKKTSLRSRNYRVQSR